MVLSEETTPPVGDLDPPFLPEPTVVVNQQQAVPTVAKVLDFAERWRRELFGACAIVVAGIVGLAYVARVEEPVDPMRAGERERLSAFAPLIDDGASPVVAHETGASATGSNPNRPAAGGPEPLTGQDSEQEGSTTTPPVGSAPERSVAGPTATTSGDESTLPLEADPPTTSSPATDPSTSLLPSTTRPPETDPPTSLPPETEAPTTTIPPRSPVARGDAVETEDEEVVKIKVLDNDDPGSASFDEDSLQIIGAPAHAEEYRVDNEHLHYKSVEDFEGVDTMTYRICNDDGLCDVATVVVTVDD